MLKKMRKNGKRKEECEEKLKKIKTGRRKMKKVREKEP